MERNTREKRKKEYMDEMERLRKENAELMDIKKNWSEKIHEIDNAKEKLRKTLENAEKTAKKARLSEILSPFTDQAWGYMYDFAYVREKCEKCDDEGYVHFKSPQGHDYKELCDCRKKVFRYSPVEAKVAYLSEFNSKIKAVVKFPRKANPEDGIDTLVLYVRSLPDGLRQHTHERNHSATERERKSRTDIDQGKRETGMTENERKYFYCPCRTVDVEITDNLVDKEHEHIIGVEIEPKAESEKQE